MVENFNEKIDFIWSIADLLRGDYKQSEYQKVILPLTVLRRLDCVTERNKEEVLERYEQLQQQGIKNVAPSLKKTADAQVYNTSEYTFESLCNDPDDIAENLQYYINQFDEETKEIFEKFEFDHQIQRLEDADLLYKVVRQFAEIDLHPEEVPNEEMGYIYEELIRKFNELSNETAGEHFTPREVIELMVNLVFQEDDDALTQQDAIRTVYDPACGTGGMLSVAEEYVRELNSDAKLHVFGQELNPESYAVCNSDMLIKGQEPENIVYGNSFTEDGFPSQRFDYMLSNPPFGVSWKKVKEEIEREHEEEGYAGRFGAGTPRVSDGSLLFLQHMLSKMKSPSEGGSRIAIVFNGSPLFNGGPNSGESAIRRWIIENDWLEAVIGLPNKLFYNTPIYTYIWVLSNSKSEKREGKVQLIDGREMYEDMVENLGDKHHRLSDENIQEISNIFGEFSAEENSRIFSNEFFGYRRIVIDQPLRMSYQVVDDRIAELDDQRAFTNRDEETQQKIKECLRELDSSKVWEDREEFRNKVELTLNMAGLDVRNSVYSAIERALGQRDEEAEIVTDNQGTPEHDIEKREYEKIPLGADPHAYFQENVEPYSPEAWINEDTKYHDDGDGKLGIVGYEIGFLDEFLRENPISEIGQIEERIHKLQGDIERATDTLVTDDYLDIGDEESYPGKTKQGPDWAGEIPEGWDSAPLKYNVTIESGSTPSTTNEDYWEGKIPWFSPKDIKSDVLNDSEDHITDKAIEETSISKLPPNTVIVVVRGMILDHSLPVAVTNVPATINQDMKALKTNGDLLPEYLLLVLKSISPVLLSKVKESSHGTKRLDTDDLKNVEIPVPPINDQKHLIQQYQSQSDIKDRKLEDLRALEEKLTELESSIGEHHKAQLMSLISGGIQDSHK